MKPSIYAIFLASFRRALRSLAGACPSPHGHMVKYRCPPGKPGSDIIAGQPNNSNIAAMFGRILAVALYDWRLCALPFVKKKAQTGRALFITLDRLSGLRYDVICNG